MTGLLCHGDCHGLKLWDKTPAAPGKGKQYICTICRETFDKLEQLMVHMKVQAENKYWCDECEWHFNLVAGLNLHGHDYHDTRHNAGHWCPEYFKSVEELHQHTRRNHFFECSNCFDSFPTAEELRHHKQKKHGGHQPSEEEQLLLR